MNDRRGGGSLRERRPGVWEVRVAFGADPVSGLCRQRSITVRGDRATAELQRQRWAGEASVARAARRVDPTITMARMLGVWLLAEHRWRPSTVVGYRSVVSFLVADPIGRRRVSTVSPVVVRAACARWVAAGAGEPTVWARVRVLRSALRWEYAERIVDHHPLHAMRGHSVATALVARGEILQAQYRLGHADAYTTLRTYAHAQPLHDGPAADTLEALYNGDARAQP